MKVSEILAQAMGIALSMNTSRQLARNAKGYAVPVLDPEACSFCAIGACAKVGGTVDPLVGRYADNNRWDKIPGVSYLNQATQELTGDPDREVWKMNDLGPGVSYSNPLRGLERLDALKAVFIRAIELAREDEGVCQVPK